MTRPSDRFSGQALQTLRSRIVGTVALPDEPDYARVAPWNTAVPIRPAAAVVVAGAGDVAEVIRFAAAHGLTVAVQATGHGAVPVGHDTILVHTGDLTGCRIDADRRIARVGAGTVWQQVLDAAAPFGLAAACGSAPGVSVAGLLTGGGIGPLVRSIGLCCDHVRGFQLVTGRGDVRWITPEREPELFWGVLGSKSTLGIITAVDVGLLPIAEFYGGAIYFDGSDAADVLHAWRTWCTALPESVTTSAALLRLPALPDVPQALAGRLTVAVRCAALCDAVAAERLVAPIRDVAPVLVDGVRVMPYTEIASVHADPVDPMPVHETHALLASLPDEAVDALLAAAGPTAGSVQVIVELRQLGGAMACPAGHRSAFCHRDAAFSMVTIGALAPDIAHLVPGDADRIAAALAPWSTGRSMPNFAPAAGPQRLAGCYDEATLRWLDHLADRHDPAGVLRAGQVARIVSAANT